MKSAWNAACRRAGFAGTIVHDLRRCAVMNLDRAGVSRSVAMELTGHKTESVYRRYAIADSRALEEGVEKLARLFESQERRTVVPIREAVQE
jgi:integrase